MNRKYLIKLNDATVNGKPIGIYVNGIINGNYGYQDEYTDSLVITMNRERAHRFGFDESSSFIDSLKNPQLFTMEFESIGHPEIID